MLLTIEGNEAIRDQLLHEGEVEERGNHAYPHASGNDGSELLPVREVHPLIGPASSEALSSDYSPPDGLPAKLTKKFKRILEWR